MSGKIYAGIPFSAYPSGVDLTTTAITAVHSSKCILSGNTGTTLFDVANPSGPNFLPAFGGSDVMWTGNTFDPLLTLHTSGITLPINPDTAVSAQTVGPFWTSIETGKTGSHIIDTKYSGYSITYTFFSMNGVPFGVWSSVTGLTSGLYTTYTAGTLDYKGPLDYLSSAEDITASGTVITKNLRVFGGASASTIGYVLTQVDAAGNAEWAFNSASASTNTFVASGVLDGNDDLILTYNTAATVPAIDLSALKFTGGSTDCIDELHVEVISACTDAITLASPVESSGGEAIGDNTFAYTNNDGGFSQARGRNSVLLGGNLQNTSVGAINSAIIGGSGNTINVSNTAIIAGTGITASDSNTVYMNNLEVTHITNTDTLRVRNNAITGYVLTATDNLGNADWLPNSSADTNTFVTGGTLNGDILDLIRNDGTNITISGFSNSFSGGSGNCITDLYTTNIHGCSPLNINPLDEGNVYFGSTSGVTIDVLNSRIGIGTDTPEEKLHVSDGDLLVENGVGTFYTDLTTLFPVVRYSGSSSVLAQMQLSNPDAAGISMGYRGFTEPTESGYGKQGDGFIYSSSAANGLNIVSQDGGSTKEDYIRFYGGKDADFAGGADMFISGNSSSGSFIGISTESPEEKLHIQDGNLRVEYDQDGDTRIRLYNIDAGTSARTLIALTNRGIGGVDTSGLLCYMGPNFSSTALADFQGEFLPNSLNITTAGGGVAQRAHINIGSRSDTGETRFFSGGDDFNSGNLLGRFFTSGLTITDMTNTNTLRVRNGAVGGYVLTATDSDGNASWQPDSGGGTFTGNTSGDCINELWVANISGCTGQDLHIGVQGGQDIYFDNASGTSTNPHLYINDKGQIGIGTNTPFSWAPTDGTGIEVHNDGSNDQIPLAFTESGTRRFFFETDFANTSNPVHLKGSSGTNLMTFNTSSSSARVGVGTTIPDGTFQIAKSGAIANQTKYPDETNLVINNTSNGYSGTSHPYSSAFRFDHGTGEDPGGLITSKRTNTWDSGEKSSTLEIWNASGETNFKRIDIQPEGTTTILGKTIIDISDPTSPTGDPDNVLETYGGDVVIKNGGVFFTNLDFADGPIIQVSGDTTGLLEIMTLSDNQGLSIGTRGTTEPTFVNYGKQGDGFLYSSAEQNGLNIISSNGTGTEDFIKFFAGKTAASANTPDLFIMGTGATKGYVGIGIENPIRPLHVEGDALIKESLTLSSSTVSADPTIIFDNPGASNQLAKIFTDSIGGGMTGELFIQTADSGVMGTRLRIDQEGKVGIGVTSSPTVFPAQLTVEGSISGTSKVYTDTLQVQDGATTGFVLTSDVDGNATWQAAAGSFTGNTSGDCIDELWVTIISGCSPVTIGSSIQSQGSVASGLNSFAYGDEVSATGNDSQALGKDTVATGDTSHAQGEDTVAGGDHSHAEGKGSKALGDQSHAEGNNTTASADNAHAEGTGTEASGNASHAEGRDTIAGTGVASHAEGRDTIASGTTSHAQGRYTVAGEYGSHAGGHGGNATKRVLSTGEGSFAHFTIEEMSPTTNDLGAQQDFSVVIGGRDNNISGFGNDSAIIGGQFNSIDSPAGTTYNAIIGGLFNSISGDTNQDMNYCSIIGGQTNIIRGSASDGADHSGIFSSHSSLIESRGGKYNTIIGGVNHDIITNEDGNSIIGGLDHSIGQLSNSAIIGGDGHTIGFGVDRTVILGGSNITALSADTVYVPNLNLCEFGGVLYTDTISGCSPVTIGENVNIDGTLKLLTLPEGGDSVDEILVRSSDGTIKYRDAATISGCCSTSSAPVAEEWVVILSATTVSADTISVGDIDVTENQGGTGTITSRFIDINEAAGIPGSGKLTATRVEATVGEFSEITSASPLHINPGDEGDVVIGSTSGFTYDVDNSRLGLGIQVPTETLHIVGGDAIIDDDHDDVTALTVQNFNIGTKANSKISLLSGGDSTGAFMLFGGANFTNLPGGNFLGSYITNALNIGTGGGAGPDRGDINIGTRKEFGQIRFFGGSGGQEDDFDDNTLLGTFHTTGLTITDGRTTNTDKLKVRDGAEDGYVLQSDASGNATWEPQAPAGNSSFIALTPADFQHSESTPSRNWNGYISESGATFQPQQIGIAQDAMKIIPKGFKCIGAQVHAALSINNTVTVFSGDITTGTVTLIGGPASTNVGIAASTQIVGTGTEYIIVRYAPIVTTVGADIFGGQIDILPV